ncbi:hypothetical protein HaLaN_14891 [Haematococcus lacustris]|uniref:Uncharacterized protein n=1 Tax=Haematococcus lacustris TaxID=44745 RepID=A0A699Z9N9_HAELA|nr:hypothetical protein HaLaN_14891 [Haematococcus lacustris]
MPALDRKHLNALRTACSMPQALISPGPACPPSQSSCSVLPLRLPDAHCHPQQGPDSQERLQRVQAPAVAVMGGLAAGTGGEQSGSLGLAQDLTRAGWLLVALQLEPRANPAPPLPTTLPPSHQTALAPPQPVTK